MKATYSASMFSILCICKLFQPKPVGAQKYLCHRGDKISKQKGEKEEKKAIFGSPQQCQWARPSIWASLDQPSNPLPGHLIHRCTKGRKKSCTLHQTMATVEHCGNPLHLQGHRGGERSRPLSSPLREDARNNGAATDPLTWPACPELQRAGLGMDNKGRLPWVPASIGRGRR